jgi:hypothetical protein
MWVKQCHNAPIFGMDDTTYKIVIWEMVYYCFTHIQSNKHKEMTFKQHEIT